MRPRVGLLVLGRGWSPPSPPSLHSARAAPLTNIATFSSRYQIQSCRWCVLRSYYIYYLLSRYILSPFVKSYFHEFLTILKGQSGATEISTEPINLFYASSISLKCPYHKKLTFSELSESSFTSCFILSITYSTRKKRMRESKVYVCNMNMRVSTQIIIDCLHHSQT